MSTVTELQQQRNNALTAANEIVSAAERTKRPMTATETANFDGHMRQVQAIDKQLENAKSNSLENTRTRLESLRAQTPLVPMPTLRIGNGKILEPMIPKRLSTEYAKAFGDYLQSAGKMKASLGEATSAAGGFAVPIEVDNQIVPLAPTDCALRRLATVRETDRDVRVAQFATFGSPLSSPVTEGSAFPENDPTLGQFTLSAFMVGSQRQLSLELVQDVPTFIEEVVQLDCAADQLMYEESAYVNGTGSGQPQGLIGNVGSGIFAEPDGNGNLVSTAGIESLIGSLKAAYLSNATFLMSRSTALIVRAAQFIGGVYKPVFHRGPDGVERLYGYSVEYSDAMPTAARGAAPVLFGDFKRAYLIGDRGGSALMVKVIEQTPLMLSGGLAVVIAFRRTDGRVRRAEAIQQYNISAS